MLQNNHIILLTLVTSKGILSHKYNVCCILSVEVVVWMQLISSDRDESCRGREAPILNF